MWGSAGTAARFLTALLGLKEGRLASGTLRKQMRRRPMEPLFSCLKALGTKVVYEGEEGHFPFTLIVGKRGSGGSGGFGDSRPSDGHGGHRPQQPVFKRSSDRLLLQRKGSGHPGEGGHTAWPTSI